MAQFPGVQWNLRPDYVALTQRVDPAGIVTAYNPPRPGVSATDVTSFVFGQANITINDWPEIMYYLHPTREWHAFRSTPQPQQKLDAQGQPMFERQPSQGQTARPLLDFPILPDTISSQEELWWIDLWRRMDPRIHWEDILMRIELPTRTVEIERHLQNSTNNLINRHEHRLYFMLAWHSTNANGGVRTNEVRSHVLRRVAAAQTPLPPNSTRGVTPGMIDPLLGNVPGNIIPQPVRRVNQGRLRVGGRAAPAQVGAPATANAALPNAAQAYLLPTTTPQSNQAQAPRPRNNQGRSNHGHDKQVRNKRRRKTHVSSSESEGDITSFSSDESNGSDDTPPRLARARDQDASARKDAAGKRKDNAGKRKLKSKSFRKTKKVKRSVIHQRRKSTSEAELENDADESDVAGSSIPQIFHEGDPGFEEAFQASRQRRRAQRSGRSPRRRHRSSSSRRTSRNSNSPGRGPSGPSMVSDSELLGEMEDDTLAPRSTATNPQVPAPPSNPTSPPAPLPRENRHRSAITGLPFAGRHRNRRKFNLNRDAQPRRRASPNRDSPIAQATRLHVTEDITGRAIVTGASIAAALELPVGQPDRPALSVYAPAPDRAHHHYTDGTGTRSFTTYPEPSSNSRIGFTPGQRASRPNPNLAGNAQPRINPQSPNLTPASNAQPQTNPQSPNPNPASNAQPVGLTFPTGGIYHTTDTNTSRQADRASAHAHALNTHRAHPRPSNPPPNRLAAEIRRHNNALDEEQRRREQWSGDEMGRHANAIRRILGGADDGWTRGFLDREHERERREIQGSSDDE